MAMNIRAPSREPLNTFGVSSQFADRVQSLHESAAAFWYARVAIDPRWSAATSACASVKKCGPGIQICAGAAIPPAS